MKKAITLLTVVFASATAIASASPSMYHKDHEWWNKHEMNEQYQELKTQVETAIMENDYEAYKAIMTQKQDMSTWNTMKKEKMGDHRHKEWFTESDREERIQAHFDEQVAYYQENGELMQKRWMPSHKRSGKYFWNSEKWIVKAALQNVSDEKVAKVIERIDMLTEKLDTTHDEQVLDMLLGIREVLVAKLST